MPPAPAGPSRINTGEPRDGRQFVVIVANAPSPLVPTRRDPGVAGANQLSMEPTSGARLELAGVALRHDVLSKAHRQHLALLGRRVCRAPAFVADRAGRVLHTNCAATALSESTPQGVMAARLGAENAHPGCTGLVARTAGPGVPECFLVALRHLADVEARLRLLGARWTLTPRERDVPRGLVRGDSNKEIAIRLGCNEGNVERHFTSLLRKSRSDGPTRLVAQFWTAY